MLIDIKITPGSRKYQIKVIRDGMHDLVLKTNDLKNGLALCRVPSHLINQLLTTFKK